MRWLSLNIILIRILLVWVWLISKFACTILSYWDKRAVTDHALSSTAHLFGRIHMLWSFRCTFIRLVLSKATHTPKVHHLVILVVGNDSLSEFGLFFWNCRRTALMFLASHRRRAFEEHLFICVHLSLPFALPGANTFTRIAI